MYKNPIELVCGEIQTQVEQQEGNMVINALRNIGVNVDKEELAKALQYDREQYKKGYEDCKYDVVDKIRAEIEQASFTHYFEYGEYYGEDTRQERIVNFDTVMQIIDKYTIESEVEKNE